MIASPGTSLKTQLGNASAEPPRPWPELGLIHPERANADKGKAKGDGDPSEDIDTVMLLALLAALGKLRMTHGVGSGAGRGGGAGEGRGCERMRQGVRSEEHTSELQSQR